MKIDRLLWQSAALHRLPVRVYIEDTDAGGVVYYANYLKYAERGRTEMLRAAGISHAAMMRDAALNLAVRKCAVEYLRPARLDDQIMVETAIGSMSGATISLKQRLCRDGIELTLFDVTVACIGADGKPRRIPTALREAVGRINSIDGAK
jgi:acyl-CoA thioester hydrolase